MASLGEAARDFEADALVAPIGERGFPLCHSMSFPVYDGGEDGHLILSLSRRLRGPDVAGTDQYPLE